MAARSAQAEPTAVPAQGFLRLPVLEEAAQFTAQAVQAAHCTALGLVRQRITQTSRTSWSPWSTSEITVSWCADGVLRRVMKKLQA